MFACQELRKRYGSTVALGGVDLSVDSGELVGLLGPNGAGKSTLVKIACGLVRPSGGSAQVDGAPAGSAAARAAIGYLAELFRFPGWLRADELLELHQRLAGSAGGAAERAELLALVGLATRRGTRVEAMSKGMQQRLGIAQALVGSPRLLMLDEPTSALDPVGRRIVRDLLLELKRRGVAVLLNSHLLSEVERVCDRVAILVGGRSWLAAAPAELARARGVEVDLDGGVRAFPEAEREDVPAIVARLVAEGERVYGVRVLSSTLEDTYLEAVGGAARERRRHVALLRAAGVDAPSGVRRRAGAHGRLPRALRAWAPRPPSTVDASSARGAGWTTRCSPARPCSAWRCSPRSSSAACSRCSSPWELCAATPSAGCCSRSWCARSDARRCSRGRFVAAAGVCAAYVAVVTRRRW